MWLSLNLQCMAHISTEYVVLIFVHISILDKNYDFYEIYNVLEESHSAPMGLT